MNIFYKTVTHHNPLNLKIITRSFVIHKSMNKIKIVVWNCNNDVLFKRNITIHFDKRLYPTVSSQVVYTTAELL